MWLRRNLSAELVRFKSTDSLCMILFLIKTEQISSECVCGPRYCVALFLFLMISFHVCCVNVYKLITNKKNKCFSAELCDFHTHGLWIIQVKRMFLSSMYKASELTIHVGVINYSAETLWTVLIKQETSLCICSSWPQRPQRILTRETAWTGSTGADGWRRRRRKMYNF